MGRSCMSGKLNHLFKYAVKILLPLVFLLAAWVLALLGPLSLFLVPGLVGMVVYALMRRRYVSLAAVVLLNPLFIAFLLGCRSYLKGAPTLYGMGLPRIEYFNIDPDTRCFKSTGGCLVRGNEWVFQVPSNFAVRLLAKLWGPAQGCYDGPYPTTAQALARLASDSVDLGWEDFINDRIPLGERVVSIEPETGKEILRGLQFYLELEEDRPTISAALFQDRCLIARIKSANEQRLSVSGVKDYIIFFDTQNGMPFAYYALDPNSSLHFHPVRYTDTKNIYAFFEAARNGDVRRLDQLRRQGFDVDTQDICGRTALMVAAHVANPVSLRYLLEKGANSTIKDNNHRNALDHLGSGWVENTAACERLLREFQGSQLEQASKS